ncbi:hypothetical protein P2A66_15010, partial [Xanthomonas perforans]
GGKASPAASRRSGWAGKAEAPKITALKDVQQSEQARVSTGIGGVDRGLGGGGVGRFLGGGRRRWVAPMRPAATPTARSSPLP